jgi:DNA-binding transcriptional regulator LsrR (DeoR family)
MAGRPKAAVSVEQVVALTNAGLGATAIAQKLGVSRSVVSRLRQAAQNEGVLGVKLRRPKTVARDIRSNCSD